MPREPGSEEYLDSEKYELRHWDLDRPDSLRELIARVNRHPPREPGAAARTTACASIAIDNEQLLVLQQDDADGDERRRCVVVNLDPHHAQAGWVDAATSTQLGLDAGRSRSRCTTC